jgi:ATP-dependent Lhr-like helicase
VSDALSLFHPEIRRWFEETYGQPTDIQTLAWPAVAAGRHVLLTAPTGSGKTLCAFLWALNQLISGAWSGGTTRVLYVSPLRALNNDIRCNLVHPLREIRERLRGAQESRGGGWQEIAVMTRSGDTPREERRRMLRRPPEILITTPESINLLLSSPRARETLIGVRTVILDEVHAVASTRRGTHLFTAVERLVRLAGEFQRVALSATVRPLAVVAQMVGGFRLVSGESEPVYEPREVTVLESRLSKRLDLRVRFPAAAKRPEEVQGQRGEAFWKQLVRQIIPRIRENRSTLIFTNTRRHAEKLARLINEQAGSTVAYAHHGSLSKEVRLVVESRLKAGQLQAIVATSSLELGIDIGELDEVILVQTPSSVSSGLQRIGRAGHAVGAVSRGTLFPLHGLDLLQAALMTRSVVDLEMEEVRPVNNPLDLLAQIILSMTGLERWDLEELYRTLRTAAAYRDLPRRHFDLVVDMLAGRYAGSRLRELEPRVFVDRLENTIEGRRGALPLVYRAGGTIPDRGSYELRVQGHPGGQGGAGQPPAGGGLIGELDEEFVWERRVGDTFHLGTQNWKIVHIGARSVEVVPWEGPVSITPFWRAERTNRDFRASERLALALERWNGRLDDPELSMELRERHLLEGEAADALVTFLRRQRAATAVELPHRHHLLVEHTGGISAGSPGRVILHTLWGGRVNQPLALALQAAWNLREHGGGADLVGGPMEIVADDECIMMLPPEPEQFNLPALLARVRPERLEELLRHSLQHSGVFGARFRENAGRALLLPRSDPRHRVPLWLTRLRAKRLLEVVGRLPDFPILLETWRACLEEEFDLPALRGLLEELHRGEIRIDQARTLTPSPFAQNITWLQTNQLVYEGDAPGSGGQVAAAAPGRETLRELLLASRLRPRLDPAVIGELVGKLQRTAPGYSPRGATELLELVKERLLLPRREWEELLAAIQGDHGLTSEELLAECGGKLLAIRLPGASEDGVVALESLPRLLHVLGESTGEDPLRLGAERLGRPSLPGLRGDLQRALALLGGQAEGGEERQSLGLLLSEWLRSYGPVEVPAIGALFGLAGELLQQVLADPVESGSLVLDQLTLEAGGEPQVCDAENLEILLRLTRRGLRPPFRALPLEALPVFLASHQGLTRPVGESRVVSLREAFETLFGYPAPPRLWEEEILPARLSPYFTSWLDGLLRDSELLWLGCGREQITFCFASDVELFAPRGPQAAARDLADRCAQLLPALRGRFSYWDLVDHSGLSPGEVTRLVWELAWAGALTSDSFAGLRSVSWRAGREAAVPPGFPFPIGAGRRGSRGRRLGFDRWRASHPFAGSWYALDAVGAAEALAAPDAVDEQELSRERVRQLLRRYGILFRELLNRELPSLHWSEVFRTLRIMELAGEVVSGQFFEGIPGLQFMSHTAFRTLERGLTRRQPFWLCAADPASPCGLGLPLEGLPPRLAANHLVYCGGRLVLVSRRRGRELEFRGPPEAATACGEGLPRLFADHLERDFEPWKSVLVETINGVAARSSPYKGLLKAWGFVEEYRGLVLRARP